MKYLIFVRACMLSCFSHVQLFATLWGAAHQALLPMGFSRQRILEWVATPSSRGSSRPRDQNYVSYVSLLASRFFTTYLILYEWKFTGYFYNENTVHESVNENKMTFFKFVEILQSLKIYWEKHSSIYVYLLSFSSKH